MKLIKKLFKNGLCKQKIAKVFFEIEYEPTKQHTNKLCSESFKLPNNDKWYVVWKDDSITIFEDVH